jgi:hypothetical protein
LAVNAGGRCVVRDKADKELERVLDHVEPRLGRALRGQPALEIRQQVQRLLAKLPFERLRIIRATAVLGRPGTAEAGQLLERLAKGPREARLTQQAKAVLERLARRPRTKS